MRVSRVVTVIDAGRIINPKPARNQIEGAVVMGVGMALFEETNYDSRFGGPINNNLADYMLTTNADAPAIDVTFLDYPDTVLNSLGARGVGEIGLAGIAAAITSAVHHATGVRVRELPIRIEDLLAAGSAGDRLSKSACERRNPQRVISAGFLLWFESSTSESSTRNDGIAETFTSRPAVQEKRRQPSAWLEQPSLWQLLFSRAQS